MIKFTIEVEIETGEVPIDSDVEQGYDAISKAMDSIPNIIEWRSILEEDNV